MLSNCPRTVAARPAPRGLEVPSTRRFALFSLDPTSTVPPYEQLRQQVARQIGSGELTAGSLLPTVRQLAADLGLAPNTVARSYKQLEADGLVITRGRRGTVVAGLGEVTAAARDAAVDFVTQMRVLGLSRDQTLRLLASVYDGAPE
ncbi:GntR family transcriptional regulator [Microlunatus panaciterrae]|uniref:DNA-binding transcriptional regulator YhcF (GntR family) n=1 Tax=Microlunatus panaciterrae TaxID=400768 RepID=A0ABS2RJ23_9ACTN|nr:GntR family transcriptional regulator [Microlunatus panaciterrae]MBM7799004.1 DNA-binding transcriptional regulator YhcF (GntR family) [Microlunatus panaciterrae]